MKILKFLVSPVFMGSLLIIFAAAMAAATFIENDFGSGAAYSNVYDTRWFELILILLAVNLTGQLIINRLFTKKKLTIALFHLAFILMIIGAGITRYFGWEGAMHIREGETTNICSSNVKYLGYKVTDQNGVTVNEHSEELNVSSISAGSYKKSISAGGKDYKLVLAGRMADAIVFHIFSGIDQETIFIKETGSKYEATASATMNGMKFEITYGSKTTELPFSLMLNDFILERYPGSDSPSGYKSDITLIDKTNNVRKPFMIFMNNILKYKSFRFYQSSYDDDESGTILSVNRDRAGMTVTYTGYFLLFLFIILSLLNRNSRFNKMQAGAWYSPLRKALPVLFLFLLLSGSGTAGAQRFIPGKEASGKFGEVLVQDQKGRTKPLFTLSSDIVRKVTRENRLEGYTSMQVFLGLYLDFEHWKDVPLLRVTNRELQSNLGITGNYAAFTDLVKMSEGGTYKLSEAVNAAYSKSSGDRSKLDKEVMKVDERLNIVYMIHRGDFMKIFPLRDSTNNWGPPAEALKNAARKEDSTYLERIIPTLAEVLQQNNAERADLIAGSVKEYQSRFTGYSLPSQSKINAEVFYYRTGIFERLFPFYTATGLVMIIVLIIMVIRGLRGTSLPVRILSRLLFAGFILHTLGLVLRWYISGHSPMSNGYESMLFISWVTMLAGFIFSRKSVFALSATAVLSGMTLLVAHMSFMDPEITNLVPVLKSYWLTLHVSVITGSYGFLGLGALLGLLNIILLILSDAGNRERISDTIDDLTLINFKTLTLGLYLLTIGTFLGAVWANESWGRYWGWDPKETWSLITIIVYTIVTHSRMIPGMKDVYTFNVLSLFGFSSVLMTYFGVNYYLSGLHSYASGDPVPVPVFVYVTVLLLIVVSGGGYFKYSRFKRAGEGGG